MTRGAQRGPGGRGTELRCHPGLDPDRWRWVKRGLRWPTDPRVNPGVPLIGGGWRFRAARGEPALRRRFARIPDPAITTCRIRTNMPSALTEPFAVTHMHSTIGARHHECAGRRGTTRDTSEADINGAITTRDGLLVASLEGHAHASPQRNTRDRGAGGVPAWKLYVAASRALVRSAAAPRGKCAWPGRSALARTCTVSSRHGRRETFLATSSTATRHHDDEPIVLCMCVTANGCGQRRMHVRMQPVVIAGGSDARPARRRAGSAASSAKSDTAHIVTGLTGVVGNLAGPALPSPTIPDQVRDDQTEVSTRRQTAVARRG